MKNYRVTDNNTYDAGLVYYRLMTIDRNRLVAYSSIVDVNIAEAKSEFRIFPNPAKDFAELNYFSEVGVNWNLSLYKGNGTQIQSSSIQSTVKGVNKTQIKISGLQAGLYSVNLSNSNDSY